MRIPIEPEVYDLIFTESERDGLWPVNPDKTRSEPPRHLSLQQAQRTAPACSAFDQPDAITSCPVRPVSTHALQALSLFNSSFMQEVSHDFAARLERACGSNRICAINTAWRLALARASAPGGDACSPESFCKSGGSLPDFCLALFNRNEFVYVP